MKAKKIFNRLAMVLLLPAMLLTTACSNDDDAVNNDNTAKKGYPLQVTVNVTRQGDGGTTRATYNESTRKLEFSAGDQLFVTGVNGDEGSFAGTLTWTSGGTFSGTIYTEKDYSGTPQGLLEASGAYAILLPAGYDKYNFLSILYTTPCRADPVLNYSGAFATSKATAVEQFSLENAFPYSNGFALSPQNAILNFTITGLTPSTNVTATLTYARYISTLMGMDTENVTISEKVTTDVSGNATFAVGVEGGTDLNNLSLTVGGNAITLASGSKTLTAGHIYNITRSAVTLPEGALSGKFTINESGKQVYFSKGNLQATYNGTSWSWAFATNQWDYIGEAEGNTKVSDSSPFVSGYSGSSTTVDLFGWVGASSAWDDVNMYGLTSSEIINPQSDFANSYGTSASESLKSDWGNTIDGNIWRTLTSDEWEYLLNTRASGSTVNGTSNARYTHIEIAGTFNGLILFPDGVTIGNDEATSWGTVNGVSGNREYATKCDYAQWIALQGKGCVFLPAAGEREEATINGTRFWGYYWSSSPGTFSGDASCISFHGHDLNPQGEKYRRIGCSVRLVCEVE